MIREQEIEELKTMLDSDGKIRITDDLPPAKKERYEFINSLNLDLVEVLSRKKEDYSISDDEVRTNSSDDEDDDVEVETLDDDSSTDSIIEEDDSATVDDLSGFF